MSAHPLTVGRYVVQMLAANGIDTVFGIPGAHNIELYRELAEGLPRHVLVHHEQNAGFAADGHARATGRPAAAFVGSGPGLTNILTALAQAHSDSVPLLLIASTPVSASLGNAWGVRHELRSQQGLAAAVCSSAATVRAASEVRDLLVSALTALTSGRPGPVYLGIPKDVLTQTTGEHPERLAPAVAPPEPAAGALDEAARLLQGAHRPLIVAGGGAVAAAASIGALADDLDGYVVTTTAGKGILPEAHPANLGASLQYASIRGLAARADVVLAVGTGMSESDLVTEHRLALSGRLIRIDIDPARLSDQYGAEVRIWADARTALEALAQAMTRRSGWRTLEGPAAVHRAPLELPVDAPSRARAHALQAIRAALPEEAVVFTDMTQIAYLGNYLYRTDCPGAWFHPSGYGACGYALPAALGAKIAQPRRPILALTGDFSLQLTLQELITCTELGLSLPVVVWNNSALGQIRDDMLAAGITPLAVTARNPDFPALAHACGAHAERVQSPAALTQVIRSALLRRGPTLIEACEGDFL